LHQRSCDMVLCYHRKIGHLIVINYCRYHQPCTHEYSCRVLEIKAYKKVRQRIRRFTLLWELGHKALRFDLQHQSPAGE
ncbi:MAG TPA: hypothetical protein VLM43_05945, partial [Desulfobacterales bacterium]|nr:hypothetical protein [Desulfobacterales bacterium]